jgi:anti-sigma factor RsiW
VTGDEVRDLFSTAFDEQLTPEQRAAFDAALAADEKLREEYRQFREMVGEAQRLSLDEELAPAPPPDLLQNVQTKLRKRSRGRFYRDRFSEKTGTGAMLPIVLGTVMLLVLAVAYLVMQYVQPVDEPRQGRQGTSSAVGRSRATTGSIPSSPLPLPPQHQTSRASRAQA